MPLTVKRIGKGNLRRFSRDLPEIGETVTREFARAVVARAKEVLAAEGILPDSPLMRGFEIKLQKVNQFARKWIIGNTTEYAVFVEFGRRPGSTAPPYDEILDWVYRMGIQPNNPNIKSQEGLAYIIQQHIAQEGINGLFFLTKAFGDSDQVRVLARGFSLAFRQAANKYKARGR